jgi:hypothetical protein
MLRAGICDLGTCDLEMGGVGLPAGPGCRAARPPHPTDGFLRPGETGSVWGAPSACRRARVRRAAGLLHVPPGEPLTCSVTVQRAMMCRICARRRGAFRREVPCVSARIAAAFPLGTAGVSAPGSAVFPPGGAAVFPRGMPGVSARTAPARGASRERLPSAPVSYPRRGLLPGRRLLPGVRCISPTGRTRRNGSSRRPRGDQPLTSGPARVRLIRRMTRRSRSMAAR